MFGLRSISLLQSCKDIWYFLLKVLMFCFLPLWFYFFHFLKKYIEWSRDLVWFFPFMGDHLFLHCALSPSLPPICSAAFAMYQAFASGFSSSLPILAYFSICFSVLIGSLLNFNKNCVLLLSNFERIDILVMPWVFLAMKIYSSPFLSWSLMFWDFLHEECAHLSLVYSWVFYSFVIIAIAFKNIILTLSYSLVKKYNWFLSYWSYL